MHIYPHTYTNTNRITSFNLGTACFKLHVTSLKFFPKKFTIKKSS